jgi:hypothetical protein
MRRLAWVLVIVGVLGIASSARADFEDRPAGQRAAYTALAVVENVVPGFSAMAAPRCLPGYILCKAWFAGFSLVAAAEHVILSGGNDMAQTQAILHRGFAGDWILTGRHAAGDATPDVLPDPGPVVSNEKPN